jgi:hypothetical protein
MVWGYAVLELKTLRDRAWVVHNVMNFYLLARWSSIRHAAESYFLDMSFTHGRVTTIPDPEELTKFRRLYPSDSHPHQRVVFIALHAQHYFTCIFDYDIHTAWLLGADFKRSGCFEHPDVIWDEWAGSNVWTYISNLFGWNDAMGRPERIIGIDWLQVRRSG